jgi:hypothetical protein
MKTFAMVLLCVLTMALQKTDAEEQWFGMNLNSCEDYQPNDMFVDVMKSSRGWGSPAAPWDLSAPLDADGWPSADAGVVCKTGARQRDIGGTYRLSFTGQANVAPVACFASIQNRVFNAATNTTSCDVVVDPQNFQLMLSFTGTNGGVKNVKLIRPGYTTETFTTPFLDLIRPFSCLRYMWVTQTIDNVTVEWADRTLPTHATQNRRFGGFYAGAAWEYVVELANLTHKDLWITIPDLASDDYVLQLAAMLRDNVDVDLKIYVEWSNEVWNGGYRQTRRNLDAAVAEANSGTSPLNYDGTTNPGYLGWRRVGKRTKEISDLFRTIFGDDQMMTRIRPVLCAQHGYTMTIRQPLEFLNAVYGPPSNYLYAISCAPYFGLTNDQSARTDLTADDIFAALPANLDTCIRAMRDYTVFARWYNVKFCAYEGGFGLVGTESQPVKAAVNDDPRIRSFIRDYCQQFCQMGGDFLCYFCAIHAHDQYGTFGLTDNVHYITGPKYLGVLDALAAPRAAVTTGSPVPAAIGAGQLDLSSNFTPAGNPAVLLQPNLWIDYLIRVPASGTYTLTTSARSNPAGQFAALLDSAPVATWNAGQNWATTPAANLELSSGLHVIQLRGVSGPVNVQTLTIGAIAPEFVSAPTVNPSPVIASRPAFFSASAHGSGVALTWNFGDGSPLASGENVSHTFASAGPVSVVCTATDVVNQQISATLNLTVQPAPVEPPAPVSPPAPATPPAPPQNGNENFGGSGTPPAQPVTPENPAGNGNDDDGDDDTTIPPTGNPPAMAMQITTLKYIVNFSADGMDSCSFSGVLPLASGLKPAGQTVSVSVAGASAQFELDAKGRARNNAGNFSLRLKNGRKSPARVALFTCRLNRGSWDSDWADAAGIDLQSGAKRVSIPVVLMLTIGETDYSATLNATYSSKSGKSGQLKR